MALDGLDAPLQSVPKYDAHQYVEREKRESPCPGPTESGRERQWTPVEKTLMDPTAQTRAIAEIDGQYIFRLTVNDGRGVADQPAADDDHIAGYFGVRPQFQVAEHRHRLTVDFAVDVTAAQDRNHGLLDRPCDFRITQNRDDTARFAVAGHGAEDRDNGIRLMPFRQR